MKLIPGDHPSVIQQNVHDLKQAGYEEHHAIHHAHAHAKSTAAGEEPPALGHMRDMYGAGKKGEGHGPMSHESAPRAGLTSPGADGPDVVGHLAIEHAGPPHGGADVTDSRVVDPAGPPMIQPSHKGRLHKALGVPEGEPIPAAKLASAANSKNPHMRQMANFAKNAKSFSHKHGS